MGTKVLGLAVLFLIEGCLVEFPPLAETDDDMESDTQTDTDTGGDADSDIDADSDSDSSGDADIDGDADTDTDTDGDADSDTDTDTDTDTDADSDTDTSDFDDETKEIEATCNIYGAGLDTLVDTMQDPGILPIELDVRGASRIEALVGQADLQAGMGWPVYDTEGGIIGKDGKTFHTDICAWGGISGIKAETFNFLAGVFLTDSPPSGDAPDALDFNGNTDFAELSPILQQLFFIGDGVGKGSNLQRFNIPVGATRLFLGFADAWDFIGDPCCIADNIGSVEVTVRKHR